MTRGVRGRSQLPLHGDGSICHIIRQLNNRHQAMPEPQNGMPSSAAPAVMLADAGAPAVLAGAPLAVMLADAGAPAVLAGAPPAVMLADAGAPAVLALAPAAFMLADVGAVAVLALA